MRYSPQHDKRQQKAVLLSGGFNIVSAPLFGGQSENAELRISIASTPAA